jgi:hypothetical protein
MLTSRACHSIILLAEAVVRLGRLQGVEGGQLAKASVCYRIVCVRCELIEPNLNHTNG